MVFTLSTRVARHLMEFVKQEELRPGDQVPSEVQIGRDLQVSRGSVREAYRTLAALGILGIESGRRPRLRLMDPVALGKVFEYALNTAQISLTHVSETRRAIEMQSAQLAARHATEPQRAALRDLMAQMRSAGSDHERRAADTAIHSVIAEAGGNPLNSLLLNALRQSAEASARNLLDYCLSEGELARVIDAHDVVVERICAGDSVGAAAAMSYHFDCSNVRFFT
ncbi:MAG TPA: FCD domain-containing protein [Steroidobacteraceae bacterium]|jgi:GntR family transcriptional repressor for pyruvate dehydrogenase complex|nr:FCD domain-containing protein [Steroidobacteraceae bacterium]